MKTNPLDQLKGICEQLLFRVANLHKSFKHFFIETMICYLSITGRVNFSQMPGSASRARVDATERLAIFLTAVQTLLGKRKGRTPDYLAHMDDKDSLIGLYLRAFASVADKLRGLTDLVVADAYFAKRTFVLGLECLAFNLVSRFRDDVRLRYLYNGPRAKRRGRPKKFDGDVDIKNPREDVFKKTTVKDGDSIVTLYFAKVYAVSLMRAVGAVIVVYDDPDKKTQVRKVYFSTDLTLSGEDIYWVYRSRFGIEFLYRDGKQFTGLTNCQARNQNSLDFAFNASLTAINIAKALSVKSEQNLSVEDVKLLIHNTVMVQRLLSTFGKTPNFNLNQKNIKELLFYGVKSAA